MAESAQRDRMRNGTERGGEQGEKTGEREEKDGQLKVGKEEM